MSRSLAKAQRESSISLAAELSLCTQKEAEFYFEDVPYFLSLSQVISSRSATKATTSRKCLMRGGDVVTSATLRTCR